MLDVCCDLSRYVEYVAMVKAGNECQPQPACRHTVTYATLVCYAGVSFQSLNTLPAEHETCNASVVIWSGGNGARRAPRNATLHSLSAYSQDLLFTAQSLKAVCIESRKESCPPSMHGSSHHVWSLPALHAQPLHAQEPTLRAILFEYCLNTVLKIAEILSRKLSPSPHCM